MVLPDAHAGCSCWRSTLALPLLGSAAAASAAAMLRATTHQYKGTLQLDDFESHNEPDEYGFTINADAVGELDKRVSKTESSDLQWWCLCRWHASLLGPTDASCCRADADAAAGRAQELYKGVAASLKPQILEALQQLVQEMLEL